MNDENKLKVRKLFLIVFGVLKGFRFFKSVVDEISIIEITLGHFFLH